MRTFKKFNKRNRTLQHSGELSRRFLEKLSQMTGCPEQTVLVELWRNWHVVMGEEIAMLCLPLGHKGDRLEVGCEDSMAMQELQYQSQEIVSRANSFMEKPFFSQVKISLVLDKPPLWSESENEPARDEQWERCAEGIYLKDMDPDSAIARCYRAYCKKS